MTFALAADELPPHHSSDVPLAFGKVDPQNPSCFASRFVLLCATIGTRFGFLGRVHRKNDSERSDKPLGELCQEKSGTYANFLSFFANDVVAYLVFPEANSMFPGATPRRLQSSAYKAR